MRESFLQFIDDKGCITLNPWQGNGQYDNENPTLFTGEFDWLYRYFNCAITVERKMQLREFHHFTTILPGLYRRRLPEDTSEVSHDEYTGKLLQVDAGILSRLYADDICAYGKSNFWSYNDKKPYKLDIKKIRQPRDIYLYKLLSVSYKPNWFDYLGFVLAGFIGIYSNMEANGGTKILWWFRYKLAKNNGASGFLLDFVSNKFYKKYDLHELCKMYYKNPWHPIITLARMAKESGYVSKRLRN
jgi:hypothetical protein